MKEIPVNNQPVSVLLNESTGVFTPCPEVQQRKLSDLVAMFADKQAVQQIIASGDRLVYEIRYYPFITKNSDMALGTTIIFPGSVNGEYHMTRGHFHRRSNQPEIYHCVQGEGVLQMMTKKGDYVGTQWTTGTVTHIPPPYAHRVVNTGRVPLVFVASFHVAAGHDYGPIEQRGFKYRIVERDGKPVEVLNPTWAE